MKIRRSARLLKPRGYCAHGYENILPEFHDRKEQHHFGAAQWVACIIAVRNSHAPALFEYCSIKKRRSRRDSKLVNPILQSGTYSHY